MPQTPREISEAADPYGDLDRDEVPYPEYASHASKSEIQLHVEKDPSGSFRIFGDILTDAQINEIYTKTPAHALQYTGSRLTQEQFDYCCQKAPMYAMEFTPKRMTSEQIETGTTEIPKEALRYIPHLLSPAQIDRCGEEHPQAALVFALPQLDDNQLARFANRQKKVLCLTFPKETKNPLIPRLFQIIDTLDPELRDSVCLATASHI